jgi:Tol biopolymer transport system component
MIDDRELLERELHRFTPEPGMADRIMRRRDRKRRNQRVAAGVLGAAIALAIAIGGANRLLTAPVPLDQPSTAPPRRTDVFLELSTGEATPLPESIAGPDREGEAFAVSPDGTMLAFESDPDAHLYVSNMDGTEQRRLTRYGLAPQWSPDGTEIVYASGSSINGWYAKIRAVDVLTSEVRTVAEVRTASGSVRRFFRLPSYSPDGRTILVTTTEYVAVASAGLATVPAGGGEPTALVDGAYGSYSPDGTAIAFVMSYPGELLIADQDGGNPRLLVAGINAVAGFDAGRVDVGQRPAWSPDGTRIAFERGTREIVVVEVATGGTTIVGSGARPTWVDNDTLIIESYLEAD